MQILDYSGRPPAAADIAAAGYAGAARYGSWQPNPKVLTAAEAQDYWAHGLSLAFVWEVGVDPTSSDPAAVGAEIDRQMRADGFPDGWGFFVAMDEDCPQERWAAYAGWGDACAKAAGRPWRGYCMSALGEQLVRDGHFPNFWDPYAWSGEDGQTAGRPSPHACLFQRLQTVTVDGTDCDVNDVLQADWLGYKSGNAPVVPPQQPPPLPAPVTIQGDTDVASIVPLNVATDTNGNGDAPCDGQNGRPVVPFAKCLSITANGADPETNHGYSPIPRLSKSNFNGQAKIELEGGPPNATVLVWVTIAA